MTISRRGALSGIALSILAIAVPTHAAERKSFDARTFQAAQEAGKSIVVHVTAPWCGTCKAQKPSVAQLADRPEFKNVIMHERTPTHSYRGLSRTAYRSIGRRPGPSLLVTPRSEPAAEQLRSWT